MSVSARARSLLKRARRAWRMEQIALHRRRPIVPHTVVYESFAGNGALDNPEALYRALIAADDQRHLTHIWVLDRPSEHRATVAKLLKHPRTRIVARHSSDYWRALSTSQYLVNNATFPAQFAKREGQMYLNTWHGTPLKKMGYDMPQGGAQSSNVVRNFLAADVLLSQSAEMTDLMYRSAFKLDGIFRGSILEAGYPRVDRQFLTPDEAANARRALVNAGLALGERTLVVYAPTWRGGNFSHPENDAARLLRDVRELQSLLGPDVFVALKTHQVVHRLARSLPELSSVLVPNRIPTNVILGIADTLVTDYSSIFFDFLPTGRPLVFYTPEASSYEDDRGLYTAPEDLPGPVVTTVTELAKSIRSALEGDTSFTERREVWRARFTPNDDGHASERVIDIVFRGRENPEVTRRIDEGRRRQILIHLGGLRANGITSSVLNLLRAFDYTRADITAIYNTPRGEEHLANQARIDANVRQLPRIGGMNGSKLTHIVRRLSQTPTRISWHRTRPRQRQLWDDEFTRLFGDARFDAVVDFSGYSPFWAALMLHSPGSRSAIWMHSDLAAEARGKASKRRSLTALSGLYGDFDRVVSVSGGLNDINRDSFIDIAGNPERFVFSRNLIDPRFLERAHHPQDLSDDETTWSERLKNDREHFWFVTLGRYSLEKNQERMIRAFAIVARERDDARLLLIGYGVMREHLENVIAELRLEGKVFLVGPLMNPAPVLLHADGFVLSSDWEGQPMVLLEAAALGVPIVTVAFGSVWGALPPGQMRIVERDVDALAVGMLALAQGEVAAPQFELDSYNAEALSEFEAATE